MTVLQKISLTIGVIIGVVALIDKFSSYKVWSKAIFPFIKWWPSGWVFLTVLLLLILIIQSQKLRAWWYLSKYGDKTKIRGLYLMGESGKVYLATKNGFLRWVKNPETLMEIGYDFNDVLRGNRSWFKKYKAGTSISIYFWK